MSSIMIVELTQGHCTLIDERDYLKVSKHKWFAHWDVHTKSFYAERGVWNSRMRKVFTVRMHRYICGLIKGDKKIVDHINHNTLDNRRENLRVVSQTINHLNRNEVRGYSWHKIFKKYISSIKISGKSIHLGYFTDKEEARNAYLKAKEKYFASLSL